VTGPTGGGAHHGRVPPEPDAHGRAMTAVESVLRERLVDAGLVGDRPAPAEPEVLALVDRVAAEVDPLLPTSVRAQLARRIRADVAGLGPLEDLMADPSVTEIMVNGPGRCWVERAGRLEPVPVTLDAEGILRVVERVVAPLGLRLDRASPLVDARLPDGSRLHAVGPPLALDGPYVTIRRFRDDPVPAEAFGVTGTAAAYLRRSVEGGHNVLVSGGTSAGKTTLLGALSAWVPAGERVVTIEETAELALRPEHVVRLEARPANSEGAGAVTVRDLVRTALRMRPDRLVIGEVRGAEAFDLLLALNTGHAGSLCTVHANSGADALGRIETLATLAGAGMPVAALRAQMQAAIDVVVHTARAGRQRRVVGIGEVHGSPEAPRLVPVFTWRDGGLVAVGAPARPLRRHVGSDRPQDAGAIEAGR